MKFAKRLEAEAVAEWRPKYLQYRQLKKLINTIAQEKAPKPGVSVTASSRVDVEKGSYGALSSNEVLFFERFETELGKIDEFYKAREREAVEKKFKIMTQLQILPDRDTKRRKKGEVSPTVENPANVLTWRSFQGTEMMHRNDNSMGSGDEGADFSPTQFSVKSGGNHNRDDMHMPEHLKISSLRRTSFNHLARLRIKKALLEFYRSLELLRNFKSLNILGCTKILKKFDKNAGRGVTLHYTEKLRACEFYKSTVLDSLMTDAENIYRWVFTAGDRGKALRKLRVKDLKRETFHGAALVCGILVGLCAALAWRLFSIISSATSVTTKNLGLIYFGLGLPFLMAWLFGINSEVWERSFVNYRFIFEFNQRNNLHVCQYSALVGTFSLFYLLLVSLSIEGWLDGYISRILQPWAVLTGITLLMVWPTNHLYRQSRIWLAKVFLRILTAPFYPCRFKDFFINDQYMSLTGTFEVFGMLIYCSLAKSELATVGTPDEVWYIYILQMLPGFWRSMQCMRRYHDSKMAFPHLANLGKYMCSLSVPMGVCIQKVLKVPSFFYIVIVLRAISSVFSLSWDIVMDFGLWQRSSVNDRLRNTILFKPWIYWYLIFSDTVARGLWILALLRPYFFPQTSALTLTLTLWTIEVLRRFQWNFFRVEYEHVNNCNVLRAVSDVPLPFTATDLFYQDMVETIHQQQEENSPCSAEGEQVENVQSGEEELMTSPCSSIAGDDMDEDDYEDSMSYEQQLMLVQKSAHTPEPASCQDEPSLVALDSGWSPSAGGSRPAVSTLFKATHNTKPGHSRSATG